MNCRDNESLILAERDGALTKAQLASLSDHVAACPACAGLRANLKVALDAYHTDLATVAVPDVNEEWRNLQSRLHEKATPGKRPLAPVIWFGAALAVAAALAFAFFVSHPTKPSPSSELAQSTPPPVYDSSTIAGADYVEPGDPNASTMVYVDKESGWLVVWATDVDTKTSG